MNGEPLGETRAPSLITELATAPKTTRIKGSQQGSSQAHVLGEGRQSIRHLKDAIRVIQISEKDRAGSGQTEVSTQNSRHIPQGPEIVGGADTGEQEDTKQDRG